MHESLDQEISTLQSIFWSEHDPDGLAFASLADAFRRKGAVREALNLLTDGMSRHPEFVTGHVVATRLYFDQGMHSEAELAARRVLELDPENLVALSTLATILTEKGDRDEAARHRETLMSVDPASEEAQSAAALDLEPEVAEPVLETLYESGSPDALLDDLTLQPLAEEADATPEEADEEISRAMDALGLVEEGADILAATSEESADGGPEDEALLPGPEAEFADLDALVSEEPVEEVAGTVDFGGPIDLDSLAPDEPTESDGDVMDLAALAPDEPAVSDEAEDVMDLAALAPDEPTEPDDDVMDLASLAPDEPAEPDEAEDVMDLASLAPDEPTGADAVVMDLAALAPEEPAEPDEAEDVMDLADLAPDVPAETDDVMDLAELAPSQTPMVGLDEVEVTESSASAPEVMDLAALAPDEPAESDEGDEMDEGVDLSALAPEESVEQLAEAVTDESLEDEPMSEEPEDEEPSKPIYTRTLADLYVRQGFPDKALGVLKALQKVTPDDEDLARRIAALEAGPPEEEVSAGKPHSEDDVETRARELAEHGDDGSDGMEVDNPFAWSASAEASNEAQDGEETAGSYFDALLEWETREHS